MYVVEFVAPDKPWSLNQERKKHYMWRSNIVAAWRDCTELETKAQLDMSVFTRTYTDGLRWNVDIDLPVKGNMKRDPINFVPTVKAIVDGMTLAGCWSDDTPNLVRQNVPELVVNATVTKLFITRVEGPRNGNN